MPNLRTINNRAHRARRRAQALNGSHPIPALVHILASGRTPAGDMDAYTRSRFVMMPV